MKRSDAEDFATGAAKLLRFKRRSVAWSLSVCSGVFLFIGLAGLITEPLGSGSLLFSVGLTVLSAVLFVRTFRMATVIVRGDNLLIRGFLRSRQIPLATIRLVETIEQPNMYGMGGRTFAIRTMDDRTTVAGEFWSRIDRSGNASLVDEMTRQLNVVLQAMKST